MKKKSENPGVEGMKHSEKETAKTQGMKHSEKETAKMQGKEGMKNLPKEDARLYLAQALINLMSKNTLEEIHVGELVKRAGVSRMTYYRYFGTKREILTYYMEYIFLCFLVEVEQAPNDGFGSYDHIEKSISFFGRYREFALCLHKAGMEGIMLDALNEYIRQQPSFHETQLSHSYPFYFYAGALYNTYMQWVLSDQPVPPSTIAKIISHIFPAGVKGAVEKAPD